MNFDYYEVWNIFNIFRVRLNFDIYRKLLCIICYLVFILIYVVILFICIIFSIRNFLRDNFFKYLNWVFLVDFIYLFVYELLYIFRVYWFFCIVWLVVKELKFYNFLLNVLVVSLVLLNSFIYVKFLLFNVRLI